jgi:hypothetical protein
MVTGSSKLQSIVSCLKSNDLFSFNHLFYLLFGHIRILVKPFVNRSPAYFVYPTNIRNTYQVVLGEHPYIPYRRLWVTAMWVNIIYWDFSMVHSVIAELKKHGREDISVVYLRRVIRPKHHIEIFIVLIIASLFDERNQFLLFANVNKC